MSDNKIKVTDLESNINKQLQLWTADMQYGVCALVDEKADKLKNLIQENAPVRYKKKIKKRRKGKYKCSWKIKVITDNFSRYEKVVYSSGDEYRLTHLLEKGHAKKGGGRVAPKIHIAPARDRIEKEYVSGVESLIKSSQRGGGGRRHSTYKK